MRQRAVRVLSALIFGMGVALAATPSQSAEPDDWVSVTTVRIDRLGGVNVVGEVSCEGAFARLEAGELSYENEFGEWVPIPYDGEPLFMDASTDNYTVSQPAGRKAMIQVTHGSSQLTPCYGTSPTYPNGEPQEARFACDPSGAPCAWQTNAYDYDYETFGPLFDYSPDGKFKTGLLNVTVRSTGLLIQIQRTSGNWDTYWIEEGSYAMAFTTLKAVSYR